MDILTVINNGSFPHHHPLIKYGHNIYNYIAYNYYYVAYNYYYVALYWEEHPIYMDKIPIPQPHHFSRSYYLCLMYDNNRQLKIEDKIKWSRDTPNIGSIIASLRVNHPKLYSIWKETL